MTEKQRSTLVRQALRDPETGGGGLRGVSTPVRRHYFHSHLRLDIQYSISDGRDHYVVAKNKLTIKMHAIF